MPKSVLAFAGWETGLPSWGGGTGGVGGSGPTSLLTIVSNQYGRPGYQAKSENFTAHGAEGYSMQIAATGLSGVSGRILVMRGYFAWPSYPISQNSLICGFNNGGSSTSTQGVGIRLLPSGKLEAGFCANLNLINDAYTESATTAKKTCVKKWYMIDAYLNTSANPWTLDWQINGVAQTQVTHAATAADWTGLFGGRGINGLDSNTGHVIVYHDDFAVTNDSSQYPLGPARSLLLHIDGFGTNVGTAAFRDESGGAITGTSWQRLNGGIPPMPPSGTPPASAGDGLSLQMFGPFTTTNILEFTFDNVSLNAAISQDVCAVQPWITGYESSPTPTNLGAMNTTGISSGGGQWRTGFGSGTNVRFTPWSNTNGGTLMFPIPPPAGGWTQTELNALKLNWHIFANAADASTKYYGISKMAVEAHLTSTKQPFPVGCSVARLPLLGVG